MPEYSEKVKRIIELYNLHFNNEMKIIDYVKSVNLTEEESLQSIKFLLNHPHAIRSKKLIDDIETINKIRDNVGNSDFNG